MILRKVWPDTALIWTYVAKVFEFGTPEYEELLPAGKRQPGSRAVIWVDVHKVGTVRRPLPSTTSFD